MRVIAEERGSVSLLGLGILGILSALGAAAFMVAQQHFDTVRLFSDGISLRLEAQNGIIGASERIAGDDALRDSVPTGETSLAVSMYQASDGSGTEGTVYARRQGNQILLLSVSRRGEARGQVLAYMEEQGGRWRLARWEH
ncbi:MAG: hypothetical protein IJS96_02905 [Schwartzia sp.]|nr:hypothetical protein [Schwartzia sp. (in: firmicutes)]